jgi:hypothetical protein
MDFKNYRTQTINLSEITGVDLDNGTFTPDPRFTNFKQTLRQDVLDALSSVQSVAQLEPILIYQSNDGKIHVLDGFHRLTTVLNKYKENNDLWCKVPYRLFRGSEEDARFEAFKANLDDARSSLTPSEEFSAIKMWLDAGYEPEEIVTKIGRNPQNVRWVNKVKDIMNGGVPAVQEAIQSNKLDVTTATAIARKLPPEEQEQAVSVAIEAKKAGLSDMDARKAAGVGKEKKALSTDMIYTYLFEFYDVDFAGALEEGEVDDVVYGQFLAIVRILQMDHLKEEEVCEIFDDMLLKREEKAKKVSRRHKEF